MEPPGQHLHAKSRRVKIEAVAIVGCYPALHQRNWFDDM